MKIILLNNKIFSAAIQPVEMVERKGIGHPDTLADIVAETFSNKYSVYTSRKFGYICNHAVDKIALLGSKSEVGFGEAKTITPITACLFGKAVKNVGSQKIDIFSLFKESVEEVFIRVFRNPEILKVIKYEINVHDGIGFDHPKSFYQPLTKLDLKKNLDDLRSNDSVMCSAYAPYSIVEKICVFIENFLNSDKFKERFPETGFDIKVLATKINCQPIDITICIPFICSRTPSKDFYALQLQKIEKTLSYKVRSHWPTEKVKLFLNTKDDGGKYAYLTVFGSALDKGDQGMVGRGNRYNGVISINREMSLEAPAGKNPLHHSGKIYNTIAFNIAKEIYQKYKAENCVNISARNGDFLSEPSYFIVKSEKSLNGHKSEIEDLIKKSLKNTSQLTSSIISSDPVELHRERPYEIHS